MKVWASFHAEAINAGMDDASACHQADEAMKEQEISMNASDAISLARKNLLAMKDGMVSSAELCLSDALTAYEKGDYESAKARAVKSLAYSVGILHADYRRAQQGMA